MLSQSRFEVTVYKLGDAYFAGRAALWGPFPAVLEQPVVETPAVAASHPSKTYFSSLLKRIPVILKHSLHA